MTRMFSERAPNPTYMYERAAIPSTSQAGMALSAGRHSRVPSSRLRTLLSTPSAKHTQQSQEKVVQVSRSCPIRQVVMAPTNKDETPLLKSLLSSSVQQHDGFLLHGSGFHFTPSSYSVSPQNFSPFPRTSPMNQTSSLSSLSSRPPNTVERKTAKCTRSMSVKKDGQEDVIVTGRAFTKKNKILSELLAKKVTTPKTIPHVPKAVLSATPQDVLYRDSESAETPIVIQPTRDFRSGGSFQVNEKKHDEVPLCEMSPLAELFRKMRSQKVALGPPVISSSTDTAGPSDMPVSSGPVGHPGPAYATNSLGQYSAIDQTQTCRNYYGEFHRIPVPTTSSQNNSLFQELPLQQPSPPPTLHQTQPPQRQHHYQQHYQDHYQHHYYQQTHHYHPPEQYQWWMQHSSYQQMDSTSQAQNRNLQRMQQQTDSWNRNVREQTASVPYDNFGGLKQDEGSKLNCQDENSTVGHNVYKEYWDMLNSNQEPSQETDEQQDISEENSIRDGPASSDVSSTSPGSQTEPPASIQSSCESLSDVQLPSDCTQDPHSMWSGSHEELSKILDSYLDKSIGRMS